MSKNNNVNPGQYKVRGRERQGEDVLHNLQKQAYSHQAEGERWELHQHPMAPPHPPEQKAAERAMNAPKRRKPSRRRKTRSAKRAKPVARRSARKPASMKRPSR